MWQKFFRENADKMGVSGTSENVLKIFLKKSEKSC